MISKDDLYLSKNEKRDITDQLQYNANLIGTFIDEVLVFTEADTTGRQLKEELFSPNGLCVRCLEANMHSIFHRQAVKLNFKRELSDEFFVKSDRHIVEVIVNKLILNSCRFTEEGSITLGCNTSERDGQIVFFVEDTGGGIPENRKNNLYTRRGRARLEHLSATGAEDRRCLGMGRTVRQGHAHAADTAP